jgi:hypothetical protein
MLGGTVPSSVHFGHIGQRLVTMSRPRINLMFSACIVNPDWALVIAWPSLPWTIVNLMTILTTEFCNIDFSERSL